MKIRNRKLVTGIVATFMAILMTGVAFAFAAQGPLNFVGTANVNAALALAIVDFDVEGNGIYEYTGVELTVPVEFGDASGHRAAAMSASFDGPDQSATFSFTVQNIGTINAEIAPIVLTLDPDSSERLVWTQDGVLETLGAVLAPGEYVEFSFTSAFDAYGFTGWQYIATAGVSFVLNYGLVGSYEPVPPIPPAVPVEDIRLTVTGGPAASPTIRTWLSAGTRGWERVVGGVGAANYTGNQNQWHRSSNVNNRPSQQPYNMLVSFPGLGTNPNRHVTFTLYITFEGSAEPVRMLSGTHTWQGGQGGTPHSVWQTFTSECYRFELNMRGNGNNFVEWWLVDTSGVN